MIDDLKLYVFLIYSQKSFCDSSIQSFIGKTRMNLTNSNDNYTDDNINEYSESQSKQGIWVRQKERGGQRERKQEGEETSDAEMVESKVYKNKRTGPDRVDRVEWFRWEGAWGGLGTFYGYLVGTGLDPHVSLTYPTVFIPKGFVGFVFVLGAQM